MYRFSQPYVVKGSEHCLTLPIKRILEKQEIADAEKPIPSDHMAR